jgi:hypothetical protein
LYFEATFLLRSDVIIERQSKQRPANPTNLFRSFAWLQVCLVPAAEGETPVDAAGLDRRIVRFKMLIDGIQLEMQAIQSDHALLNSQECPNYLGAILKVQQEFIDAKTALEAASIRIAEK